MNRIPRKKEVAVYECILASAISWLVIRVLLTNDDHESSKLIATHCWAWERRGRGGTVLRCGVKESFVLYTQLKRTSWMVSPAFTSKVYSGCVGKSTTLLIGTPWWVQSQTAGACPVTDGLECRVTSVLYCGDIEIGRGRRLPPAAHIKHSAAWWQWAQGVSNPKSAASPSWLFCTYKRTVSTRATLGVKGSFCRLLLPPPLRRCLSGGELRSTGKGQVVLHPIR